MIHQTLREVLQARSQRRIDEENLNRHLKTDNRQQIREAFNEFKKDFLSASMFGIIRQFYEFVPDDSSNTLYLSDILINGLSNGLQFSAFPLVHSISCTLHKPDLKTSRQWFSWTLKTGITSAATFAAVQCALMYMRNTEKPPASFIAKTFAGLTVTQTCFNLGSSISNRYLPPADDIGGAFARNIAVLAVGQCSQDLTGLLLSGNTVSDSVRFIWGAAPMIAFDGAVHSAIRGLTRKLLK